MLTRINGNFKEAAALVAAWSRKGQGFFGVLKQARAPSFNSAPSLLQLPHFCDSLTTAGSGQRRICSSLITAAPSLLQALVSAAFAADFDELRDELATRVAELQLVQTVSIVVAADTARWKVRPPHTRSCLLNSASAARVAELRLGRTLSAQVAADTAAGRLQGCVSGVLSCRAACGH